MYDLFRALVLSSVILLTAHQISSCRPLNFLTRGFQMQSKKISLLLFSADLLRHLYTRLTDGCCILEKTPRVFTREIAVLVVSVPQNAIRPCFSIVLFICKTKSRLRRKHCGLVRHFKTDPTETVALCFGYAKTLFWRRRHYGLARHFKTDPIKTVALCFGYAKTLFWWPNGKADEQDICHICLTFKPLRSMTSNDTLFKCHLSLIGGLLTQM
jgi:hypothetical protein